MLFWTVTVLLASLLIIDAVVALRSYKKAKQHWKTIVHFVLLLVLAILLWNLIVRSFSLGLEIPFIFEVYRAI